MAIGTKAAGTVLTLAAAFALTCMAALTALAEFMPYLRSGTLVDQKVAVLAQGVVEPGPSYRSERMVLADCSVALDSQAGGALPDDQWLNLVQHCQTIAQDITASEPTFSFAWYVAARAAEGLGDGAQMTASLVRSQSTAPRQAWLALSRAKLADRNLDVLDATAFEVYEKDLAVLVESNVSLPWLGARYLESEAFRQRITAVVETLSAENQRRLIYAVRAAGR